jgi:hypothetical protein
MAPNWLTYSSRIVQYEQIMKIGGTTYYFEPGMNWLKWVDSKYNTDGF